MQAPQGLDATHGGEPVNSGSISPQQGDEAEDIWCSVRDGWISTLSKFQNCARFESDLAKLISPRPPPDHSRVSDSQVALFQMHGVGEPSAPLAPRLD